MEKMKAAAFLDLVNATSGAAKKNPTNKYGAKKTTVNGITFDSESEARRYGELLNLERAKLIRDLQLQVTFTLEGKNGPLTGESGRKLFYKADFVYFEAEGDGWRKVVEDRKGKKTDVYLLKKAIMKNMGWEIRET